MTLAIQPDEGISIAFGAKRPGEHMGTVPVRAEFNYSHAFGTSTPVAYETLLLDAMRGDATLFTRGDEVEAEWRIITPIENAWVDLPPPDFPNYAAGSEGPESAQALIGDDHRHWHVLMNEPLPRNEHDSQRESRTRDPRLPRCEIRGAGSRFDLPATCR